MSEGIEALDKLADAAQNAVTKSVWKAFKIGMLIGFIFGFLIGGSIAAVSTHRFYTKPSHERAIKAALEAGKTWGQGWHDCMHAYGIKYVDGKSWQCTRLQEVVQQYPPMFTNDSQATMKPQRMTNQLDTRTTPIYERR